MQKRKEKGAKTGRDRHVAEVEEDEIESTEENMQPKSSAISNDKGLGEMNPEQL